MNRFAHEFRTDFFAAFEISDRARTIAVSVFSLLVVYAIIRLDFAHDLALWNFSWLADFVAEDEAAEMK